MRAWPTQTVNYLQRKFCSKRHLRLSGRSFGEVYKWGLVSRYAALLCGYAHKRRRRQRALPGASMFIRPTMFLCVERHDRPRDVNTDVWLVATHVSDLVCVLCVLHSFLSTCDPSFPRPTWNKNRTFSIESEQTVCRKTLIVFQHRNPSRFIEVAGQSLSSNYNVGRSTAFRYRRCSLWITTCFQSTHLSK